MGQINIARLFIYSFDLIQGQIHFTRSSVQSKQMEVTESGCFNQQWSAMTRERPFTLMFLICRLPSSCRDMRGSFPSRLTPSFNQLMEGMGSPEAWHFNSATLSTPSVWLDGPWRMMGGGLSVSTADTKQVSSVAAFKQKRRFITLTLSRVARVVFFGTDANPKIGSCVRGDIWEILPF